MCLKKTNFNLMTFHFLLIIKAYREEIRKCGGIPMLVGCIMSSDYGKKRYGCLALANMALSPSFDIVQAFKSKRLMDKIMKMAIRKEPETQREVTALIRNLSCHDELRSLLLERKVVKAIQATKSSVFPEVVEWGEEIFKQMEETIALSKKKISTISSQNPMVIPKSENSVVVSEHSLELLSKMTPLEGCVSWTTWGSKLDTIFQPIFASLPTLQGAQVVTLMNQPTEIYLASGLMREDRGPTHEYVVIGRYLLTLFVLFRIIHELFNSFNVGILISVIGRPQHGTLTEYTTNSEHITYVPNYGITFLKIKLH